MAPSADELKSMLELCRSSKLAHSEEIISLLSSSSVAKQRGATIEVHEMTLASARGASNLRSTYRRRAAHLTEMEDRGTLCDPSPSGRILPASLAADIRALSVALDSADDQQVSLWSIRLADRVCYGIFVLAADRRIAGSVKSVEEACEGERGSGRLPESAVR